MARKRTKIQDHLNITGSTHSDCLKSLCCPCCVLVQQDKEIQEYQEQLMNGYQQNEEMLHI